jgi:hypothetical protein
VSISFFDLLNRGLYPEIIVGVEVARRNLFLALLWTITISFPVQSFAGPTEELKQAIESGNVGRVRDLLAQHPRIEYVATGKAVYDVFEMEKVGESGVRIVSLLLQNGANPNFESLRTTLGRVIDSKVPVPIKVQLIELLLTYGAKASLSNDHRLTGAPDSYHFFIYGEYEPEVFTAFLGTVSLEERQKLKAQLPGLLKGLTAVAKARPKPPKDIRKIITAMVIAPLVDEHMQYARKLLDDNLDYAESLARRGGPGPPKVVALIKRVDVPQFWTNLRQVSERNIRRALFNNTKVSEPTVSERVDFSKEHQKTIDAFVKAYEKGSQGQKEDDL